MSDVDRFDVVDTGNSGISRRRFGAAIAGGGVCTTVHQLLGVAATSAAPRQVGSPQLCEMSAVELATRLARKQVSAREVMTAHLAQIERLNPTVNAIVTLVAEQAMAGASKADEAIHAPRSDRRVARYVTMMANPAISVPAGFSATGLPVGLQIVGRHRDEWSILQLAHAFEQATRHGMRRPSLLD